MRDRTVELLGTTCPAPSSSTTMEGSVNWAANSELIGFVITTSSWLIQISARMSPKGCVSEIRAMSLGKRRGGG